MTPPFNQNKNDFGFAIGFLFFSALVGAGFWFALTGTLDDMTRVDCEAGIVKACEQLKK